MQARMQQILLNETQNTVINIHMITGLLLATLSKMTVNSAEQLSDLQHAVTDLKQFIAEILFIAKLCRAEANN